MAINIDLNNQWQESSLNNPFPEYFYGVYESFSNYHVANGMAYMYINITDIEYLTVYIAHSGQSNNDFTVISNLDQTPTLTAVTTGTNYKVATSRMTSTALSGYTLATYTGISSGSHTITVLYGKNASTDQGTDRGYCLILKPDGDRLLTEQACNTIANPAGTEPRKCPKASEINSLWHNRIYPVFPYIGTKCVPVRAVYVNQYGLSSMSYRVNCNIRECTVYVYSGPDKSELLWNRTLSGYDDVPLRNVYYPYIYYRVTHSGYINQEKTAQGTPGSQITTDFTMVAGGNYNYEASVTPQNATVTWYTNSGKTTQVSTSNSLYNQTRDSLYAYAEASGYLSDGVTVTGIEDEIATANIELTRIYYNYRVNITPSHALVTWYTDSTRTTSIGTGTELNDCGYDHVYAWATATGGYYAEGVEIDGVMFETVTKRLELTTERYDYTITLTSTQSDYISAYNSMPKYWFDGDMTEFITSASTVTALTHVKYESVFVFLPRNVVSSYRYNPNPNSGATIIGVPGETANANFSISRASAGMYFYYYAVTVYPSGATVTWYRDSGMTQQLGTGYTLIPTDTTSSINYSSVYVTATKPGHTKGSLTLTGTSNRLTVGHIELTPCTYSYQITFTGSYASYANNFVMYWYTDDTFTTLIASGTSLTALTNVDYPSVFVFSPSEYSTGSGRPYLLNPTSRTIEGVPNGTATASFEVRQAGSGSHVYSYIMTYNPSDMTNRWAPTPTWNAYNYQNINYLIGSSQSGYTIMGQRTGYSSGYTTLEGVAGEIVHGVLTLTPTGQVVYNYSYSVSVTPAGATVKWYNNSNMSLLLGTGTQLSGTTYNSVYAYAELYGYSSDGIVLNGINNQTVTGSITLYEEVLRTYTLTWQITDVSSPDGTPPGLSNWTIQWDDGSYGTYVTKEYQSTSASISRSMAYTAVCSDNNWSPEYYAFSVTATASNTSNTGTTYISTRYNGDYSYSVTVTPAGSTVSWYTGSNRNTYLGSGTAITTSYSSVYAYATKSGYIPGGTTISGIINSTATGTINLEEEPDETYNYSITTYPSSATVIWYTNSSMTTQIGTGKNLVGVYYSSAYAYVSATGYYSDGITIQGIDGSTATGSITLDAIPTTEYTYSASISPSGSYQSFEWFTNSNMTTSLGTSSILGPISNSSVYLYVSAKSGYVSQGKSFTGIANTSKICEITLVAETPDYYSYSVTTVPSSASVVWYTNSNMTTQIGTGKSLNNTTYSSVYAYATASGYFSNGVTIYGTAGSTESETITLTVIPQQYYSYSVTVTPSNASVTWYTNSGMGTQLGTGTNLSNVSNSSVYVYATRTGYESAGKAISGILGDTVSTTLSLSPQVANLYSVTVSSPAGCTVTIDGTTVTTNSTPGSMNSISSTLSSVYYSVSKYGYSTVSGTLTSSNSNTTVSLTDRYETTLTVIVNTQSLPHTGQVNGYVNVSLNGSGVSQVGFGGSQQYFQCTIYQEDAYECEIQVIQTGMEYAYVQADVEAEIGGGGGTIGVGTSSYADSSSIQLSFSQGQTSSRTFYVKGTSYNVGDNDGTVIIAFSSN